MLKTIPTYHNFCLNITFPLASLFFLKKFYFIKLVSHVILSMVYEYKYVCRLVFFIIFVRSYFRCKFLLIKVLQYEIALKATHDTHIHVIMFLIFRIERKSITTQSTMKNRKSNKKRTLNILHRSKRRIYYNCTQSN